MSIGIWWRKATGVPTALRLDDDIVGLQGRLRRRPDEAADRAGSSAGLQDARPTGALASPWTTRHRSGSDRVAGTSPSCRADSVRSVTEPTQMPLAVEPAEQGSVERRCARALRRRLFVLGVVSLVTGLSPRDAPAGRTDPCRYLAARLRPPRPRASKRLFPDGRGRAGAPRARQRARQAARSTRSSCQVTDAAPACHSPHTAFSSRDFHDPFSESPSWQPS